jgi:pimeloyl-ACP methyl ester carboxylesterase
VTLTALPDPVATALAAPDAGQRITVEAVGIPWSALVWGEPSARPVLLIHGITSSAEAWWRVGPALAASGRRVVAVDQAGHGLTGHWTGHRRFRDNAKDIAAFARAAGLERPDLQVVGHSWGAMTAAAMPVTGFRPATVVLLDPPVLSLERISLEATDPNQQPFPSLDEAIASIRAAEPTWAEGDVLAKAQSVIHLDLEAPRSVLLENGDWDGGLADLREPAARGIDTWLIRGDPAFGGYVDDAAAADFEALLGPDHVITIEGGAHSPQRTHPEETVAAILHTLGG